LSKCATCSAQFIPLHLIILRVFGAVVSSLPPLPPSWVQIFSPAPSSKRTSMYILPLVWEIKFHTCTNNW
jgi:hypothetical protein